MAQMMDSAKTTNGSIEEQTISNEDPSTLATPSSSTPTPIPTSTSSSSSIVSSSSTAHSTTPPEDPTLAEYRLERFMADATATTAPFSTPLNASEETAIAAAEERIEGIIQAFDDAFT